MTAIERVEAGLRERPRKWLVTGAAGFIGSHLAERLLSLGQRVVAIDNFATGKPKNLEELLANVGAQAARRFQFIEGDIRELAMCRLACEGVELVLHEAALGSVPRSIEGPLETNQVNVDGFLNVMVAARDARVARIVYASSSSVYGDLAARSKVEESIGEPLSPYALSKRIDEQYAALFSRVYGVETIGLRYFNVFGPRQDPDGPYAAVIPRWTAALRAHERCFIYGDGETSRDFCYVDNVVQANLLAATVEPGSNAANQVYNVGADAETTLNELFVLIRDRLAAGDPSLRAATPEHRPFRAGDVRTSRAEIGKARRLLGYVPMHSVASGLDETLGAGGTRQRARAG